ncbi:MAG: hypothetical protein P8L16_06445, partial [Ilumatobacter sp.]|nr:hypothetical protein [Ilumatobacter sp.]
MTFLHALHIFTRTMKSSPRAEMENSFSAPRAEKPSSMEAAMFDRAPLPLRAGSNGLALGTQQNQ